MVNGWKRKQHAAIKWKQEGEIITYPKVNNGQFMAASNPNGQVGNSIHLKEI